MAGAASACDGLHQHQKSTAATRRAAGAGLKWKSNRPNYPDVNCRWRRAAYPAYEQPARRRPDKRSAIRQRLNRFRHFPFRLCRTHLRQLNPLRRYIKRNAFRQLRCREHRRRFARTKLRYRVSDQR